MASLCRSVLTVGSRSMAVRSRILTQSSLKPAPTSSLFSTSTRVLPRASRVVSVLGVEVSLMPLHSVIASARLKSRIGVETSCWSLLSQGFATPL